MADVLRGDGAAGENRIAPLQRHRVTALESAEQRAADCGVSVRVGTARMRKPRRLA